MPHQLREGTLVFSDDPGLIDLDVVHGYVSRSYWSRGIPRGLVERAIRHSLCFGAYDTAEPASSPAAHATQIAFARVITDRATFAYLCDVFVLESHQGRGIGKSLVAHVLSHPDLQGLRRFSLLTRDAHGLYAQFGFTPMADPTRYMEIARTNLYAQAPTQT